MTTDNPPSPKNIQAEDFTGYCMALGYIQANWASMEQMFDMWIALIYHDLAGRTLIEKRLPLSFKNKVKFLKRSFRNIAELKQYADEAIPLLTRAKALARPRNDLTHGALSKLDPINGAWQMVILDLDSRDENVNWHVTRHFTFSPSDFEALEAKLVPLSVEVGKFGHRLLALIRSKR